MKLDMPDWNEPLKNAIPNTQWVWSALATLVCSLVCKCIGEWEKVHWVPGYVISHPRIIRSGTVKKTKSPSQLAWWVKVQRNSICWSLQSLRCSMQISWCLYTRQSGKCRQCNDLLLPPWDARLWRVGCFTHHQPTDILARPIVRVRDLQDFAIFSKAQQQSKGSRPLWQKCDHPRVVPGFCLMVQIPQLQLGAGFEQLVIFSSTWGKFEPNSTDIFKRVEIIVSAKWCQLPVEFCDKTPIKQYMFISY